MKKKKIISVILVLSFLAFAVPVYAQDSYTETLYLSNGDYIVTNTYVNDCISTYTSNTKSAHTTKTYYSSLHVKQWDFTVYGEFTYTGKSAKAVSSSCKYKIYTSGWKCKSHSATKSGSKALAKGIFQKNNTNKTVNIGLSCSPTGKISAI